MSSDVATEKFTKLSEDLLRCSIKSPPSTGKQEQKDQHKNNHGKEGRYKKSKKSAASNQSRRSIFSAHPRCGVRSFAPLVYTVTDRRVYSHRFLPPLAVVMSKSNLALRSPAMDWI